MAMVDRHLEQFEVEMNAAFERLDTLFAGLPGDRVVAGALLNPDLKIGSPTRVVDTLRDANLEAGNLWTLFKTCGGTTKELAPFTDECDQYDALKATWVSLLGRPPCPGSMIALTASEATSQAAGY